MIDSQFVGKENKRTSKDGIRLLIATERERCYDAEILCVALARPMGPYIMLQDLPGLLL